MTSLSFTADGKRTPQKEAEVQKDCWSWLETVTVRRIRGNRFWDEPLQKYAYMVPNGTQLGGSHRGRARYMASLKAQGFRPGVSDIVIAYPTWNDGPCDEGPLCYHGVYIELKRDRDAYKGPAAIKSAVRPEQAEWLKLMRDVGYWVAVTYGLDEFKTAVNSYLAGEPPAPLPDEE